MGSNYIVGVDTTYFEDENAAVLGIAPAYKESVYAVQKRDGSGWDVIRMGCVPFPDIPLPPALRLKLAMIAVQYPDLVTPGCTQVIAGQVNMKEAFNLVRGYELNPTPMPGLPVTRQNARPEDSREYWRNIPEPA